MRTFQDLEKLTSEEARIEFCDEAVREFRTSRTYQEAKAGEAYYNKHNLTIEAYQKTITTLSGATRPDLISANYKLKTLFFRRLISQQVNYVLGNGLTLQNTKNKEKLGKDFDFQLVTAAKRAMASGVAFGFWNLDHLEVFGYADTPAQAGFCPLYDEHTGKLRAGIRFWFRYVDENEILRCTLYEEDGFTEYKIDSDEKIVVQEKRAYIRKITKMGEDFVEDVVDQNYGSLPIIPLYANDSHESELNGIRECIDAYDMIKSGLANNIDDSSEIYWILKNTGGMDDIDVVQFLHRLKTVHGAVVDGDQGADAEAHQLEVPTEARTKMLEILRKDIYEDFQILNVDTLSAAAKTTQEIQAAYQSQDNKCADFEYYLIDFVQHILELAQINDEPSFLWNKIINQSEQTQMIMQCQNVLPEEILIKHLPFLTPEEADEAIETRDSQDFKQFNAEEPEEDDSEAEEASDEEEEQTAEE